MGPLESLLRLLVFGSLGPGLASMGHLLLELDLSQSLLELSLLVQQILPFLHGLVGLIQTGFFCQTFCEGLIIQHLLHLVLVSHLSWRVDGVVQSSILGASAEATWLQLYRQPECCLMPPAL